MRTNRAPYDYQRKPVVYDSREYTWAICLNCGIPVLPMVTGSGDEGKCANCGTVQFVNIGEHDVEAIQGMIAEMNGSDAARDNLLPALTDAGFGSAGPM